MKWRYDEMKRIACFMTLLVPVFVLLPLWSEGAQSQPKASLPQVPITYPGDNDKTILRRAQWVEGARKEGKLILWTDLTPNEAKKVTDQFSKVYPFITVISSREASEEKAAKLEAEFTAGKLSVDVVEGGGRANCPRWRKMGIMEKFTDIIPGIGKIPKDLYSQYGDWAMAGNNVPLPMYNTNLVPAAEAPKSWEDLLKPQWKGKLAMTTDMKVWALFALSEKGWGMQKTENYLKKLKEQNPIWAQGHTQSHSLMVAGDYQIVVEDYLYHCLRSQDNGAPAEWVRVSPVPLTGQAFILIKNAPHPNAARLFLEWQLSPAGLKAYDEVTRRGAVYPGAGTRQARLLEKSILMPRTEEIELKSLQMGLDDRFAKIFGIKPTY
jgi:ABC-type Fe3+ transport system substrate-binding protein